MRILLVFVCLSVFSLGSFFIGLGNASEYECDSLNCRKVEEMCALKIKTGTLTGYWKRVCSEYL